MKELIGKNWYLKNNHGDIKYSRANSQLYCESYVWCQTGFRFMGGSLHKLQCIPETNKILNVNSK